MANTTLNMQLLLRRDEVFTSTYVLAAGEPGFEISTNTLKIGDGEKTWAQLSIANQEEIAKLIKVTDDKVEALTTAVGKLNDTYATDAEVAAVKADLEAAIALKVSLEDYNADKATFALKTDVATEFAKYTTTADQQTIDKTQDDKITALEGASHTHANKELLDTYTQTEANLADAVAKKHEHENKTELDKIIAGDVAKWNGVVADHLTAADKTAIEDEIGDVNTALENYKTANNEALAGVKATAEAAATKEYADAELAKKVAKTDYEADKATFATKTDIAKLAGVSEGANKVEASATNGSIKIDGVDTVVYTHPTSHTVSEISDFGEKIAEYDYATKTEAQGYANAKDEAIAAAKQAGDDAQDAIDAYIESNNTALANVKATADAAAVKADVEAALAEIYTKTEADNKFAVKGEDAYDDTALAGRVTTAEGKIEALEGASATHATKAELNAVDAKFADYATIAGQEIIDAAQDAKIKAIADDYVKSADIANFATTSNVADAVAGEASLREAADTELAGRISTLEGYFGDGEGTVADQIADAVAVEKARAEEAEEDLQAQITANANAITALTDGIDPDKIDGLTDLVNWANTHAPEVDGIKQDIEANAKAIEDHEALAAETYETKTDAAQKLADAKSYADGTAADAKSGAEATAASALATARTEITGEIATAKQAAIDAAATDASTKAEAALEAAKAYADANDANTTYTVAATANALEFTVTPSEGEAQTVKLVAPAVDTGVMGVEAGEGIVVDEADGVVTVSHKTYGTGTYTKPDSVSDANFVTGVTIENGHVTGASVKSLAEALANMTFIFDGGHSAD